MEAKKPLVSIGLPVYNGARLLPEALDSLLSQTWSDFELIISDNASTDQTPQLCQAYAARDSRIRCHRQPETVESGANFNFVLERASGEFFMWAACDDVWEPGFVATLLELLRREPDAALAFSAFDHFNALDRPRGAYPRLFELSAPGLFRRLWTFMTQKEKFGKANPIYGLMRRAILVQAGGLKTWGDGEWGADMLVVFRLLSFGKMVLARETLFHKRAPTPPATSAHHPSVPAQERLALVRAKLRDKTGYLRGYARILATVNGLTPIEKYSLRLGLMLQFAYVYWRGSLFLLRAPFKSGPRG